MYSMCEACTCVWSIVHVFGACVYNVCSCSPFHQDPCGFLWLQSSGSLSGVRAIPWPIPHCCRKRKRQRPRKMLGHETAQQKAHGVFKSRSSA